MAVVAESFTEEFCPDIKEFSVSSIVLELLPLVLPLVAYTTGKVEQRAVRQGHGNRETRIDLEGFRNSNGHLEID